jgi:hypothetical protein
MSDMPKLLRTAPQFLYVMAIVLGILSITTDYWETASHYSGAGLSSDQSVAFRMRLVLNALRELLYLLSSAMMLHALILIWDRLRIYSRRQEEEGE